MTISTPQRVAVIGAGSQGLCMLKNLLELNTSEKTIFDAEILESRDSIGGVWNYSRDPNTITALPSTLSNVTRFRNTYSDFPVREAWEMAKAKGDNRASEAEMSSLNGAITQAGRKDPGSVDGIPIFLSASQQHMYYDMYAEKNKLGPHIRYGIRVIKISKNEKTGKWMVDLKDAKKGGEVRTEEYDKVVLASGQQDAPNMPKIEGIERFQGVSTHVIGFKDPADLKGKRVMVVGFSNTAADTATALVGHADKIYMSRRHDTNVFPRVVNHVPLDVQVKRRLVNIGNLIGFFSPSRLPQMFHGFASALKKMAYGDRLKPEWGFSNPTIAGSFASIISENLVECIERGDIVPCRGVQRIGVDGKSVELEDGTSHEVDAIIFATGYLSHSNIDVPIEYSGEPALARMYQNIFLPSDPYSFACQNMWVVPTGICEVADLMSMAIAQVFAGNYQLPPRPRMEREIDIWHTKNRNLQHLGLMNGGRYRITRPIMNNEAGWRYFMNAAAGTGLNEKLGWGIQGLAFWASSPALCSLLMTGVDNPSVYRLWETRKGGRRGWDGAKKAIEDANREANAYMEQSKAKAEAEKKSSSVNGVPEAST